MVERRPIDDFRRRLKALIEEKFEGRYTVCAHHAGIPISTMQHYYHSSKRLPGGEHLQRIAQACGTTVDFLVSGDASVRPMDILAHPVKVVQTVPRSQAENVLPDTGRQLSVPSFICTCPKEDCPLSEMVPSPSKSAGRFIVPVDLVRRHRYHRLVSVILQAPVIVDGTDGRAFVDWDERTVTAESQTFLFFDGKTHKVGKLRQDQDRIVIANEAALLPENGQVLGRVVAILTKL